MTSVQIGPKQVKQQQDLKKTSSTSTAFWVLETMKSTSRSLWNSQSLRFKSNIDSDPLLWSEKMTFPTGSECHVAPSCVWTLPLINVYVQWNLQSKPGNYSQKKIKNVLAQRTSCKTGCAQPWPATRGPERKMSARNIFIKHLSPYRQIREGFRSLRKHAKSS